MLYMNSTQHLQKWLVKELNASGIDEDGASITSETYSLQRTKKTILNKTTQKS